MTAQTGTITVDGASVAFTVEGSGGPNVLLLHGMAAHRHWWDRVVPYLEPSCRILRIDFSGHGDSDHRNAYSIDSWAAEALAVQQEVLGRAPFLLAAHSLGGRAAIAATRIPGNTVTGVVVFDTVFPESDRFAGPSTWKATKRIYDSREGALARFRLLPPQPIDERILRELAEYSVRREAEGWTWKHDYRLSPASLGTAPLRRVDVPLTIAYGEHSSVVTEEMVNRAADRAGDLASIRMIPNVHHHLVLESPASVAGIILEHLGIIASTSPDTI